MLLLVRKKRERQTKARKGEGRMKRDSSIRLWGMSAKKQDQQKMRIKKKIRS